ncbi:MAG: lipopolysaccharide biosynthesis protein [Desulfobacteraceae bacterium]|nr:MAG: lipopolysaccharide biosynthesis protein [Desulfobacteraceae bacterium]
MERKGTAVTLRDFLTIVFKHKWKILTTFAAMVVTVTIAAMTIPSMYQATSTLLVKFGRENIYRSEVGERGAWVSLSHEEMVNSEIQILTSRDLIQKVVETIGPEVLYPEMARKGQEGGKSENSLVSAAVPAFKGALSVEGLKKSNVIQVSFLHENPLIAAHAVNLLVDLFREKHLQVHSDPKSSFLEQQLKAYEAGLKESEDSLEMYRREHQAFSLPEQKTLLLQQRTQFDTTLKNTRNQQEELRKKLAALKAEMRRVPQDIPLATVTDRHDVVDNIKNTLLNLQLKEQDLLMKYTPDHPMVANVQKEIRLAKEYLKRQEEDPKKVQTTGKNIVHQELEKEVIKTQAELSAQEAKASALSIQVAHLDKGLQELALREKRLEQLLRGREINEKNYRTYLEKAEEARIVDDMNNRKMANVSIVQQAAAPLHPLKPKRNIYIAFSFLFGAIGGLGFAFICEYLTQGFSTPEQVERRLGLRTLIALPYRPLPHDSESERKGGVRHRAGVGGC